MWKHGYDTADLPYKAGLFPFGPLLAFVLCLVVTLGQNYQASCKTASTGSA